MFYKSKKVLIKLIFSSIFLVLGLSSIISGLLCKFVFITNNTGTSNLVMLILTIVGSVLLFTSFILGVVNQRYLQNINNNLLIENKKQWEQQIQKEINDPNSDFVLADEKSEKPDIEEDEIININIVDDKPSQNNIVNENIPEIIINNNSILDDEIQTVQNTIEVQTKTPIVDVAEHLNNEDTIVEIQKYEEIVDSSELNKQPNIPSIQQIRPINIPPRTISNQSNLPTNPNFRPITQRNIDSNNSYQVGEKLRENISQTNNTYNQTSQNINRTIPQRTITIPPSSNNIQSNNKFVPQGNIPNTSTNNKEVISNSRPIPSRPINIPPRA